MRKIIALIILTSILTMGTAFPTSAQDTPPMVALQVTHQFGDRIDIDATIKPNQEIQSLRLIVTTTDNQNLVNEQVDIDSTGNVTYRLDISGKPIRAFSEIEIYFEITFTGGISTTTEITRYYYDDNRFDWQIQQTEAFSVYWYQDDPEMGDKIIAAAYEGWEKIRNQLNVLEPEGIHIYAYSNLVDMQDTLLHTGTSSYWIAGHAVSDLGVIIVSLPPGPDQFLEIRRQIPHELMHIFLYRKVGPNYANLPRWFNEGLASIAELSPNPDYQILLERAYDRDALIPMWDLCASFPIDAASFQLSYAEAYGFTWYLQQTYGNEKIESLIQSYAGGMSCEDGTWPVYEKSLTDLEVEWRRTHFDEDRVLNIWIATLPIIIVVGFAFIAPIGLIFLGLRKQKPSSSQKRRSW